MSQYAQQSTGKPTRITRSRRGNYLLAHPEYFSSDLESANPLLYDHLVRKWQSTQERDEEATHRETSSLLEAGFLRAEFRRASAQTAQDSVAQAKNEFVAIMEDEGEIDEVVEPKTREEAWELWIQLMTKRFISGRDDQFDYHSVDDDCDLDHGPGERLRTADDYFDSEEAAWDVTREHLKGETCLQDF